ncbi:DUF6919 domain-containing protein [Amycolatopsis sp. NPDC058986]|uniref:DUF6919 domain-containing protein n=1 Tax=unclassified Amycolatopsis TaxID=2618356 RepID=UPI00366A6E06
MIYVFGITMKRADRRQWAAASDLRALGELTARWLEGTLASQPGYAPGYGPDDETRELIPTLAAANRAGYLTDCSQPGIPAGPGYDGAIWAQRAAVSGWLDVDRLPELAAQATTAGLLVVSHTPKNSRFNRNGGDEWVVVTTRDGEARTGFGGRLSSRDVASRFDVCSRKAIDAVRAAGQLSIVDPAWGRNDVLWPLLERWIQLQPRS